MSKTKHELIDPAWDSLQYNLVGVSTSRNLQPEERLLLAVLIQAVDDATSPRHSVHRAQAREVIFSPSATPLKDICLCLDIDYGYFVRKVKDMIETGKKLRTP